MKSHLIRYGFVDNYTIWKFHSEADPSATGASKQNSSVNDVQGPQPSSSTTATAGGDTANQEYVNIDELLQDMAANDGDGDCDE